LRRGRAGRRAGRLEERRGAAPADARTARAGEHGALVHRDLPVQLFRLLRKREAARFAHHSSRLGSDTDSSSSRRTTMRLIVLKCRWRARVRVRFTAPERALVARLRTPAQVQRWLDSLPYNKGNV